MLGGHSAVEPPVPIPNTEVKCSYADGSATYVCVRVGHCQASIKCGAVVQMVRMPACHAGGRGFDPRPFRQLTIKKLDYLW